MTDTIAKVAIVCVTAVLLWMFFHKRYEFVLRVRSGQTRLSSGRLRHSTAEELASVLSECEVPQGWVAGVRRGPRIRLEFSRSIPPEYRQRLRNVWTQDER